MDLSLLESNSNDMYSRIKRRSAARRSLPLRALTQPTVPPNTPTASSLCSDLRLTKSQATAKTESFRFPSTPTVCFVEKDFHLPLEVFSLPSCAASSSLPVKSDAGSQNEDVLFATPQPQRRGKRRTRSMRRKRPTIIPSSSHKFQKNVGDCFLTDTHVEAHPASSVVPVLACNSNDAALTAHEPAASDESTFEHVKLDRTIADPPQEVSHFRESCSNLFNATSADVSNLAMHKTNDDVSEYPPLSESVLLLREPAADVSTDNNGAQQIFEVSYTCIVCRVALLPFLLFFRHQQIFCRSTPATSRLKNRSFL